MNLFPVMTPDRECALLLLARERRLHRPNLAAWASAHITISRAHSGYNLRANGTHRGAAEPQNTEGSGPSGDGLRGETFS
jgi:hypothetical protein